jgi:Membrane protein involved in the export of O-antigen and teichoic acid
MHAFMIRTLGRLVGNPDKGITDVLSFRDSLATLTLRLASLAIAFVASILFARSIGPAGYGTYATIVAWATLFAIPAALGFPEYFLREFAHASHETMRGALNWADRRLIVAGGMTAALMMIACSITQGESRWQAFLIAAPIPLLAAMTQARQSALRQVVPTASAVWPQAVLLPLVILLLAGGWWLVTGALNVVALVTSTTAAHLVGYAVTDITWRRWVRGVPASLPSDWMTILRVRAALPFIALAGLALLNTRVDILILSSLSTASETGVYAVAVRITDVLLLPMTVINMVIAPSVTRLFRSGDRARLQQLLVSGARFALLLTTIPAVLLLFFAPLLLTTLFGQAYIAAATPLRILTVAQLINTSAGSVGMALSMTGHEHTALRIGILSAALNLSLNLVLVTLAGGTGAAIGTALSLVAWRAGFYFAVRRHLGLKPTALGL